MSLEKHPQPHAGYFVLSVGSHFLWGAYPVCTRFLQTQAEPALSGLTILTLAMFIAGICACLSVTRDRSEPLTWYKWKWGIFYGAITLCRAASNILSSGYTLAYYCLVVSLLNPFITAVTSRWLLHEPFPTCFCVAAILSFMGAFAVIFGQSMTHTTLNLSFDDYVGVALAFTSVCFSSCMRLTMKKTKEVGLTKFQLVSFQYAFNFSVLLAVTCTQREQWAAWCDISVTSAFVFLFFAVAIVFGATVTQVTSVRELGPTMHSSLQPLRLLPTLLGTYLLLGEPVSSAVSWMGICMIVVVLGVYFCIQIREVSRPTFPVILPSVIGYAEVRGREHGGDFSHDPLEQDVEKS